MRDLLSRLRPLLLAFAVLQLASASVAAREIAPLAPSQIYGELFHRVQTGRIFADSKTFADATAKGPAEEILRQFEMRKNRADFSLRDFVAENFEMPRDAASGFRTTPGDEVRDHIDRLWPALTREPRASDVRDSLLPLSTRYVVPGGRFRELYYWDSYFTMAGLQTGGHEDLVAAMVENLAGREGTRALVDRLPQLEREYDFWMSGAANLAPGGAYRRVVRLADGSLLNRHWDDKETPRDEAYLEDIETAHGSGRPPAEVYRDLRAAAESGWDFSSRWLDDGKTLRTIRTTDFAPVDLNSLLYKLELVIARGCKAVKRTGCNTDMTARARARQAAMLRLMWDEGLGAFVDYDWRNQRRSQHLTAATAFPLFVDLADRKRARRVARAIRESLLAPHGLATTTVTTGQQWDAPNGWAPLQWVAIEGLRRNGEPGLAKTIAERWIAENARVYCLTGKLVEKYNVSEAGAGAGGEYPVQDGFGWTNAVLIKLLAIYPVFAGERYEYTGATCGASPTH